MQTSNKTHKKISSTALVLIIIATVSIVAYAAITYFFNLSQNVPNTRGVKIAGSWTGAEIEERAVLPGDTFTLNQTITSDSTEPVYVFVRIDTEGNAYSISGLSDEWAVVKAEDDEILIAYGSTSRMMEVGPDVKIDFEGLLTLDVSNKEFADLEDSALSFTINACGVAVSQCEGKVSPLAVYEVYVDESRGN